MAMSPSKFYLGRGDSPKLLVVAIVLKLGFGLVHYILVGPLIWSVIHPVLVIIPVYLYVIGFVSLLHAANVNPGTLPKYVCQRTTTPPGVDSDSIELGNREYYPYMPRDSPDIKFVNLHGVDMEIKYCVSCEIYRLPRCAHDNVMDECVARFDHYCIWLNNSIGERNYVFFFWFVLLMWLQMVYVFSINLYLVCTLNPLIFDVVLKERPTSLALAIAMFFFLLSMTGLTGLHTYLCCNDLTTREHLKNMKPDEIQPYRSHNFITNINSSLCGPATQLQIKESLIKEIA